MATVANGAVRISISLRLETETKQFQNCFVSAKTKCSGSETFYLF